MNHSQDCFRLDELKEGDMTEIVRYEGQEDLHQRLKELGLVKGTRIHVKRFAPLGDPMELVVRGYNLSVRRNDAAKIIVRRVAQ
jgi:Fe2+ transport system protein FeoA